MNRCFPSPSLALLLAVLPGCGGLLGEAGLAGSATPPPGPPGGLIPTAAQATWLDPHDAVRAGSMPGVTVSPTPSPALPALGWSATAEAVAQAWANGCTYAHNGGRGADGTARGENIAATGSTGPSTMTPADVVAMWASEWPSYTYSTNGCASGAVCGHYTQLVWRSTLRVGCAHATCHTGSPFSFTSTWEFWVCDYEPPGNWVGQKPY